MYIYSINKLNREDFMKKLLLTGIVTLFVISTVNAQFFKKSDIDIYKKDINKQAKDLVKDNLDLTPEQAKIFWPLYDEFRAEANKIVDAEIGIVEEYMMNYYDLSDKKATELIQRSLELKRNKIDLDEKYFDKMRKVLPAKLAGKFLQIENRISLMIKQQRTEKIPLVRKQDKK